MIGAACTPKYYGLFVNGSGKELSVALYSTGDGRLLSSFHIAPGAAVRNEIMVVRAEISSSSGEKLYEQKIPSLGPHFREQTGGERTIRFLVTERRIYLIPKKYHDNWKAHLSDIVQ